MCCNDPAKRSVLYFVMHLVACSCSGPSSIEAISTDQPETWLFCAELHFCISAYLGGAQVSPLSRRSGYIEASVGQIEDTFCFGLLFCSLIPALTHSHVFFLLQNTWGVRPPFWKSWCLEVEIPLNFLATPKALLCQFSGLKMVLGLHLPTELILDKNCWR